MARDRRINTWYSNSKSREIAGSEIEDVCLYNFGIPLKTDGANSCSQTGMNSGPGSFWTTVGASARRRSNRPRS